MKTTTTALAAALAAVGLLVSSSFTGTAFAHAHMTLTPDIENVNPISVVIGHTNEPTFGAKPGIHDGKHNIEVTLEDAETALPLTGAQLKVDKYYFRDLGSFSRATSLSQADQIERNVTVGGVFGDPGHYMARQVVQPGIYGYRLYGTIDYFGMARVPIDTTVFCSAGGGSTSKFNGEGWGGSYGCVDNINDLYFPQRASLRPADFESDPGELQQAAIAGSNPAAAGAAAQGGMAFLPALQILAVAAAATAGGFFGLRAFRSRRKDGGL